MRDCTRALHQIGERLLKAVIEEGKRERQQQEQQLPVHIHDDRPANH
jgi:hypothetical protein